MRLSCVQVARQAAKDRLLATQGLHARRGVYAVASGIVAPVVLVDRKAETLPGFCALLDHESTHVAEYHSALGALILLVGLVETSVAIAMGWWWSLMAAPPATLLLWLLWRRRMEIRADAIALAGSGRGEFFNFLRMHRHPTTWFGRWCYGKTIAHRSNRAYRLALNPRWRKRHGLPPV